MKRVFIVWTLGMSLLLTVQHASAVTVVIAKGTITMASPGGVVVTAQEIQFVANGCAPDQPSGVFDASINVSKYRGRRMTLTITGTQQPIIATPSTGMNAYVVPACDAPSLIAGTPTGFAKPGKPSTFVSNGTFIELRMTTWSETNVNVGMGYQLALV